MTSHPLSRPLLPLCLALLLIGLLAGCASPPPPPAAGLPAPAPVAATPLPPQPEPPMGPPSAALSTLDYRLDAAYHLYGKNNTRIYRGVMPHFLYAIGVLEVQVDPRGNV
ncbi:MAG: hypothetical protein VW687_11815, partial [Curvibacter sp.]